MIKMGVWKAAKARWHGRLQVCAKGKKDTGAFSGSIPSNYLRMPNPKQYLENRVINESDVTCNDLTETDMTVSGILTLLLKTCS